MNNIEVIGTSLGLTLSAHEILQGHVKKLFLYATPK